jgi:NTE family protein
VPDETWKVGLVLAGGAAKGGYQIGVAAALAEAGTRLHAVAGTSIGALNGAVISTSGSLTAAVDRLDALWRRFTGAVGPAPVGGAGCDQRGEPTEPLTARGANLVPRLVALLRRRGLLERLVEEAIDEQGLATGLPLYVTGFPVLPPVPDPRIQLLLHLLDRLRRIAGARSRILHVNRLTAADARTVVLASAALPLLFRARKIDAQYLRDGMLGGDNVPVRALVDAGCRIVVVVHLDQAATLRVEEHPELVLLEIRPSVPLTPSGPLGSTSGLLDFSPARFAVLRALGHADATRVLAQLHDTLTAVAQRRAAQIGMLDAVGLLDEPIAFPD